MNVKRIGDALFIDPTPKQGTVGFIYIDHPRRRGRRLVLEVKTYSNGFEVDVTGADRLAVNPVEVQTDGHAVFRFHALLLSHRDATKKECPVWPTAPQRSRRKT